MEKYGVRIDPKKINEREKKASPERTDDNESNVPRDPNLGTEPFEGIDERKEGR